MRPDLAEVGLPKARHRRPVELARATDVVVVAGDRRARRRGRSRGRSSGSGSRGESRGATSSATHVAGSRPARGRGRGRRSRAAPMRGSRPPTPEPTIAMSQSTVSSGSARTLGLVGANGSLDKRTAILDEAVSLRNSRGTKRRRLDFTVCYLRSRCICAMSSSWIFCVTPACGLRPDRAVRPAGQLGAFRRDRRHRSFSERRRGAADGRHGAEFPEGRSPRLRPRALASGGRRADRRARSHVHRVAG